MTDSLCLSSIAHFAVPLYITSHFHNSDDAVYSSQPMVPIYHTTLYHNPCKHIRLSLLGSLLCTQQLVPQNCVQELLSETHVNIWMYFQQHSKFLYLWIINGLKEILLTNSQLGVSILWELSGKCWSHSLLGWDNMQFGAGQQCLKEDGNIKGLKNIGTYLPNGMASQPRSP